MDAETKAGIIRRLQSVDGHVRGIQRVTLNTPSPSTQPKEHPNVNYRNPEHPRHFLRPLRRDHPARDERGAGCPGRQGDPQAKTATFTLANEAVLTDVKATLVEIGYPAAN